MLILLYLKEKPYYIISYHESIVTIIPQLRYKHQFNNMG